jgi:hypothetical protein
MIVASFLPVFITLGITGLGIAGFFLLAAFASSPLASWGNKLPGDCPSCGQARLRSDTVPGGTSSTLRDAPRGVVTLCETPGCNYALGLTLPNDPESDDWVPGETRMRSGTSLLGGRTPTAASPAKPGRGRRGERALRVRRGRRRQADRRDRGILVLRLGAGRFGRLRTRPSSARSSAVRPETAANHGECSG